MRGTRPPKTGYGSPAPGYHPAHTIMRPETKQNISSSVSGMLRFQVPACNLAIQPSIGAFDRADEMLFVLEQLRGINPADAKSGSIR
eukprot:2254323-Rhodomonas_salina.2